MIKKIKIIKFVNNFNMSRFKIVNIIDNVFVYFIIFLISLAWFNFYLSSFVLSVFLSLFLSFITFTCIKLIKNKKENKKLQLLTKENEIENFSLNFQLYSNNQKIRLISKLLPNDFEYKFINNRIEYDINDKHFIILVENNIECLNKNMLLNIIQPYITKSDNIIVFCNDYDTNCEKFAKNIKNIKIKLLNKSNLYELCLKNYIKINEKIKIKDIFKGFFSKNHSKGFFFSGIILILTSFIIRFTSYYIIFSSILLIFSLICSIKKINIKLDNWFD